jgi:hypothetical protein
VMVTQRAAVTLSALVILSGATNPV